MGTNTNSGSSSESPSCLVVVVVVAVVDVVAVVAGVAVGVAVSFFRSPLLVFESSLEEGARSSSAKWSRESGSGSEKSEI